MQLFDRCLRMPLTMINLSESMLNLPGGDAQLHEEYSPVHLHGSFPPENRNPQINHLHHNDWMCTLQISLYTFLFFNNRCLTIWISSRGKPTDFLQWRIRLKTYFLMNWPEILPIRFEFQAKCYKNFGQTGKFFLTWDSPFASFIYLRKLFYHFS